MLGNRSIKSASRSYPLRHLDYFHRQSIGGALDKSSWESQSTAIVTYLCIVKMKLFLIVFCSTVVAMGPGLCALQDFSVVVKHYRHHVEVHGEDELSFFEFLENNVGGSDHEDADHLPTPMDDGCSCSTHSVFTAVSSVAIQLNQPACITEALRTVESVLSTPASPTLQPPRA